MWKISSLPRHRRPTSACTTKPTLKIESRTNLSPNFATPTFSLLSTHKQSFTNRVTKTIQLPSLINHIPRNLISPLTINQTHFNQQQRSNSSNNNAALETQLQVGDQLEGYTLKEKFEIKEREWEVFVFEHNKTKAEHLHIRNADNNNVFGVIFKTTPKDDTGVAHILEHTTLCGSKTYPVRDPFFNMIKRSLNTYMNAWTGNDFTAYPFSSCNEKDFHNLLSVYLDAVFNPLLNELDFKQEGWRLQFSNQHTTNNSEGNIEGGDIIDGSNDDQHLVDNNMEEQPLEDNSSQPQLEFAGVVYNEMKGALSEQSSITHDALSSSLFTKATYHYNSGGDPLHIPSLTYDNLLRFHQLYYHPSNSKFYTYGNMPLSPILSRISSALQSFSDKKSECEEASSVPEEDNFHEVKVVEKFYPPIPGAEPDKQITAIKGWRVNKINEGYNTFVLHILSELLLSGPSSPFYQARLQRGNLGLGFSSLSGFSPSSYETTFVIGLEGIREEDITTTWEMIDTTLQSLASSSTCPFEQSQINGILHQLEISQKHITSNYGLNVFGNIIGSWIHNTKIAEMLDLEMHITRFKHDISSSPSFFQNLIKKYLLHNANAVKLIMRSDDEYMKRIEDLELQKLAEIQQSLTTPQIDAINSSSSLLLQHQQSHQDTSILPKVELHDVPRGIIPYPPFTLSYLSNDASSTLLTLTENDVTEPITPNGRSSSSSSKINTSIIHASSKNILLSCAQPTNQITYCKLIVPLDDQLPDEYYPLLPLFSECVAKLGSKNYSYEKLAEEIKLHTGGISASPFIHAPYSPLFSQNGLEKGILLSALSLNQNVNRMMEILQEVMLHPDYSDIPRFQTILSSMVADMQDEMISEGHRLAITLARSKLTEEAYYTEMWNGFTYLNQIQSLLASPHLHSHLLSQLHEMMSYIVMSANKRMAMISTACGIDNSTTLSRQFFQSLENHKRSSTPLSSPPPPKPKQFLKEGENEHVYITIPSPVNFIAKSIPSAHITHPDFPKLMVMSSILSHNYLHTEVREKGGAYSAGLSTANSTLTFYTYRDPNFSRSLDTFSQAIHWFRKSSLTDQMLEEAKLTLFASMDAPRVPSDVITPFFLSAIPSSLRQRSRDTIYNLTKNDVLEMAEKYLADVKTESVAAFGSPETDVPDHFQKLSFNPNSSSDDDASNI